MTPRADVTVAEVIDAARRRRALLAPEIAGYLVLAAADQLARMPALVDETRCGLQIEGGKIVLTATPAPTAMDAERALRVLLRRLLEASHGRAPALHAVASLPATGNLRALIAELEAALIPVNRGAAGRALSRLARETVRARGPGQAAAIDLAEDVMLEFSGEDVDPSAEDDLETTPNGAGVEDDLETIPKGSADGSFGGARRGVAHGAVITPAFEYPSTPSFSDEATTRRRTAISDARGGASGSDVDRLLAASGPPLPLPPVPRAPPVPDLHVPPPLPSPKPPPKPIRAQPAPPSNPARGVDELLEGFLVSPAPNEERMRRDLRKMAGLEGTPHTPPARPSYDSPFQNDTGTADFYTSTPAPRTEARSVAVPADDDPLAHRGARRRVYTVLTVLAAASIGAAALFALQPGFLAGRTPDVVEAERREAAAAASALSAHGVAAACRAALVVTDVPPGAEVLLRAGPAPVDVERVPAGARLEFVALADGYVARRAVVPAGAVWDAQGGKPRFELPIQLEKSHAKGGLDPWPAAEPGSLVGGQGPPGVVHVVTSPRGAEVWMVAGGGPEAKLEALPCGAGVELLVAGAAQGQPFRRRLRVDPSQLTPEPSARAVTGHVSAAK